MSKEKSGSRKINNVAALTTALPKIALLGRPNVGKSTLFNRLIRSNRAITHDMPGVTRDRMEGLVKRKGEHQFIIVDTGGITLDSHATAVQGPAGIRGFEEEILQQARLALEESTGICLVVDGKEGLTPFDSHLADFLRRSGKPILLVVNKVDGGEKADLLIADFHILGMEILPCSAEHGFNLMALLERMMEMLPEAEDLPEDDFTQAEQYFSDDDYADEHDDPQSPSGDQPDADATEEGEDDIEAALQNLTELEAAPAVEDEDDEGMLRLAMLGRPNVGKSSLVNALAGDKRMIVSSVAGTTRDSVDVPVTIGGELSIIVDSAGVRRRSKITESVERFSVNSALKTSTKAQVTLLVLDGQEGLTQQDKRLLELLDARKLPFIVLINKTDLISPQQMKDVEKVYRKELAYCPHIPLLMVSAHNRRNLKKILPLAREILREGRLRVGTGQLNRILEMLVTQRQPPLIKRKRAKFYYMTQAESRPPTFVFFVSEVDRVPEPYSRYLERALRKILGLKHAPIRVHFRQTKDRHKK